MVPKVKTALYAPDHWIKRVDAWRAKQPGVPPRAEAIRRLIELGLKAKARVLEHERNGSYFD